MYLLFWMCWKLVLFYQFYDIVGIYITQYFIYNYNHFARNWKGKLPHFMPVMWNVKECYTVTLELLLQKGFCVYVHCFGLFSFVFFNDKNSTCLLKQFQWNKNTSLFHKRICAQWLCSYSWKITSVHCWNDVLQSKILIWKK